MSGDFCSVDRNPVGVVLSVLVLADELAEDQQDAIVGFAELVQVGFLGSYSVPMA